MVVELIKCMMGSTIPTLKRPSKTPIYLNQTFQHLKQNTKSTKINMKMVPQYIKNSPYFKDLGVKISTKMTKNKRNSSFHQLFQTMARPYSYLLYLKVEYKGVFRGVFSSFFENMVLFMLSAEHQIEKVGIPPSLNK